MKIIATMPVRNEDWCLGMSLRALLRWTDEVVVGLHACTDRSEAIVREVEGEYPTRVHILKHHDPIWSEMAHRQALLEAARDRGATHIAIVDADEVLSSDLVSYARGMFAACPMHAVLQLPWLCLRGSIHRVHSTGVWAEQNVSMGFVDSAALHWAARNGYDFHHRHPMGRPFIPYLPAPAGSRTSGLMHLQFVSGRRLRAKQALYQMTEVMRWPGREPVEVVRKRYSLAVYNQYEPLVGNDAEYRMQQTMVTVPPTWWEGYASLMHHFDAHALPWQETEVLRLLDEHGPKQFVGLDLFGLGEEAFHARAL